MLDKQIGPVFCSFGRDDFFFLGISRKSRIAGPDASFRRSISQRTRPTHSTLCVDSRLNMVETVIPNFCTIDLRTSSDTIGGIIAVLSYWKKLRRERGDVDEEDTRMANVRGREREGEEKSEDE